MQLKAKKSLGQNFLRSEKAISDIVNSVSDINIPIIEIGGGEGVVTKALLDKGFTVYVIEIDKRAIEVMEAREDFKTYILNNKLKFFNEDILEANFEKILYEGKKYYIIGNIPYYITGLIFRKIFSSNILPIQTTLMVQKEVCDRVLARNSKESLMSLCIKYYGEVKYISTVKAGSFVPAPKVDSAIFTIKTHADTENLLKNADLFFAVIKSAFKHPRKYAISNIKKYLEIYNLDTYIYNKILNNINLYIKEKERAEDVKLDVWKKVVSEM